MTERTPEMLQAYADRLRAKVALERKRWIPNSDLIAIGINFAVVLEELAEMKARLP